MSEFTAEEYEAFDAMVRFKLLALIGMISVKASIEAGRDEEEMLDLLESFTPDLTRPIMGMGPGETSRCARRADRRDVAA